MEGVIFKELEEKIDTLAKMAKKNGKTLRDISQISIQRIAREFNTSEEFVRGEIEKRIG
jgi:hypothetical protein